MGVRGVRNRVPLTDAERAYVLATARRIGIPAEDIRFFSGSQGSIYSDLMDKIVVGADVLPCAETPGPGVRSVYDRLTTGAVLAHEYGHLLAARHGVSFAGGSLIEEFQASVLAARHTPGLMPFERVQLLRDALERARDAGVDYRTLRAQLRELSGNR